MNGPWNSQMRTIHTNTRKHRNCRWLRRCERGGGGWGWVIMYKVVVQSSPRLPCTTGGSVRTKYRPCLFSGFPKVGTRSLLSSSAVKKLTHLAEHPPTAAPTPTHRHIRKESTLTSGFGETPLPWTTFTVSVVA